MDFTPPFRRIPMIAELEKQLGVTFPPASTFGSPGMRHSTTCACFSALCVRVLCIVITVENRETENFRTFGDQLEQGTVEPTILKTLTMVGVCSANDLRSECVVQLNNPQE